MGPTFTEIFEDRFTNLILNRILLHATMLGTAHDECLAFPIEIVETKTSDLAASQTVEGIQQNHCSSSQLFWGLFAY
jgi:hypothetical protein